MNNNNKKYGYIKAKIDIDYLDPFKEILKIKKISQQSFFEKIIIEYTIKNINILIKKIKEEEKNDFME